MRRITHSHVSVHFIIPLIPMTEFILWNCWLWSGNYTKSGPLTVTICHKGRITAVHRCPKISALHLWWKSLISVAYLGSMHHLKWNSLKERYHKDHQQITFVTLNKFFPLSKTLHPLFLTDNIMVYGILTTGWNNNWNQMKNICPFYIVFQVLIVVFIKKYKIQLPDLLLLVVLH